MCITRASNSKNDGCHFLWTMPTNIWNWRAMQTNFIFLSYSILCVLRCLSSIQNTNFNIWLYGTIYIYASHFQLNTLSISQSVNYYVSDLFVEEAILSSFRAMKRHFKMIICYLQTLKNCWHRVTSKNLILFITNSH